MILLMMKPLSLCWSLLLFLLSLPYPNAMAFFITRRATTTTTNGFRIVRQRRGPITFFPPPPTTTTTATTTTTTPQPPLLGQKNVVVVRPLFNFVLANSNNINSDFEREFQQKQRALSDQVTSSISSSSSSSMKSSSSSLKEHQQQVFNELASFFDSEEAIPPEVVPILQDMADTMITQMIDQRMKGEETNQKSRPARVNNNNNNNNGTTTATCYETNVFHVLDVGCGTGALFDFYIRAAEANNITLHIHGLDLASNMVQRAKSNGKEVLDRLLLQQSDNNNDDDKKQPPQHSISVELGDICDYKPPKREQQQQQQQYDLVVANSCFGNFHDQKQALQSMVNSLRLDGVLCITHPLGSDFVRQLHDDDPKTVPHVLPNNINEFLQLARNLPLHVLEVVDRDDDDDDQSGKKSESLTYYKATAIKVVHQTLSKMMRFRGQVDSGYGRGGKKLGFPTANLPSRLFQGALQDVKCGVYFGWALLEEGSGGSSSTTTTTKKGRNIPHKAVVNVGYSPTFEGQENPEKIVEAHLIFAKSKNGVDDEDDDDNGSSPPLDPPDFYGEVMRLQLIGFIRPEMKFPSFPALIAQITTDVEDARDALDMDFYRDCRQKDPFISKVDDEWIGSGGGDGDASWEFDKAEE